MCASNRLAEQRGMKPPLSSRTMSLPITMSLSIRRACSSTRHPACRAADADRAASGWRAFPPCSPRTARRGLTWSREPRGRPTGLPDCPLANRPRPTRPLFPLSYLVEITHRQLHSMISHPLRGARRHESTMRLWQLHGCQYRKFRTAPVKRRPVNGANRPAISAMLRKHPRQ